MKLLIGFVLGAVAVVIVLIIVATAPRVKAKMEEASITKATADVQRLHNIVIQYSIDNGRNPATLRDLTKPGAPLAGQELPLDPWGRAYLYEHGAEGISRTKISSLGRDGRPGGIGLDADIVIESPRLR